MNCRNTPRIATLVHLLGNLNPEYAKILRPDDGAEPEIIYYRDDEEQKQCLTEIVQKLRRDGFANSGITLLSTKAPDKAIASMVSSSSDISFMSFENVTKNHIGYGSIHAFKGMESPAIIVTDVETITGELASSLFYIAMTRALHRLYILAHNDIKHDVLRIVLQA